MCLAADIANCVTVQACLPFGLQKGITKLGKISISHQKVKKTNQENDKRLSTNEDQSPNDHVECLFASTKWEKANFIEDSTE